MLGILRTLKSKRHAISGKTRINLRSDITAEFELLENNAICVDARWVIRSSRCLLSESTSRICNFCQDAMSALKDPLYRCVKYNQDLVINKINRGYVDFI